MPLNSDHYMETPRATEKLVLTDALNPYVTTTVFAGGRPTVSLLVFDTGMASMGIAPKSLVTFLSAESARKLIEALQEAVDAEEGDTVDD